MINNSMNIIYIHTNTITDKSYIGQTIQKLDSRWKAHLNKSKNGSTTKFHQAIRDYKESDWTHDILYIALSNDIDVLNEAERSLIQEYNTIINGYNTTPGGDNYNMTQDHKDKISQARKDYWSSMTPDERKEKVGTQGKNNAMYGVNGKDHHAYGTYHSDETKEKMSEAKKGKTAEEIWGKERAEQIKQKGVEWGKAQKGVKKSPKQSKTNKEQLDKFRNDHKQVNFYNVTMFDEFVQTLDYDTIFNMIGMSFATFYNIIRDCKKGNIHKRLSELNITNIEKSHREYIKNEN